MASKSTKENMMKVVSEESVHSTSKITVVGIGQVGMAAAYSIMIQNVASELCLCDVAADRVKGEAMDLQHGQAFIRRVKVTASTDYSITAGSKICVLTAGVRQREGETRLDLVQRNADIFKHIIPNLIRYSPDTILVVVSNPVDILTYVAWKLSGLPATRVIGSGTMLDSSRFRFLMSERLGISPQSCHGYIIGEHGDSSVAVWSGVNVAGTKLKDISPKAGELDDPEKWEDIHKQVIDSAYEIIRLKGYTSWAIGVMVSTICNCIIKNQRNVYALSTLAKDNHGISEDVYLSLPCVLGDNGITHIFRQTLNDSEKSKLRESATTLKGVIDGIQF